ncbi:MAG: HAD family phosphatase [Treponema sp.]|nr:HAD family phosphatase [Treponema sp.]
MCKIKALIFDMDGVILDSERISDITWQKAAETLKLKKTSDQIINKCRGTNYDDTVILLKDYYGDDFDVDEFLSLTGEYFREIEFSSGIPLLPYVTESLDFLKGHFKLALASSTAKKTVERQLTSAGVIGFFEKIVTGDMVVHSKPDPEIYRIACEKIGFKPEECIAVEDSPNGIKSAFNAGLNVIMVPDMIQPDSELEKMCLAVCSSLKDMCDYIKLNVISA